MENIFIEYKPEHYVGGNISITIHVKPSLKYVAEDLARMFENEILVYNYGDDKNRRKGKNNERFAV